jgi:hypothetical protein
MHPRFIFGKSLIGVKSHSLDVLWVNACGLDWHYVREKQVVLSGEIVSMFADLRPFCFSGGPLQKSLKERAASRRSWISEA